MKQIIQKIYTIDELEEATKENVIDYFRENLIEDYCETFLEEDMNIEAENLLNKYFLGATLNKVYGDLSYCQGSGAMIAFTIDIEDLNKKYKSLTKKQLEKIKEVGYTQVKVFHIGNYYHERSFDIDYTDYTDYLENFDKVQLKIERMMDSFDKDIISMNKELANIGYNLIEKCYTKEDVIEHIKNNDYYFYEDGTIYEEK